MFGHSRMRFPCHLEGGNIKQNSPILRDPNMKPKHFYSSIYILWIFYPNKQYQNHILLFYSSSMISFASHKLSILKRYRSRTMPLLFQHQLLPPSLCPNINCSLQTQSIVSKEYTIWLRCFFSNCERNKQKVRVVKSWTLDRRHLLLWRFFILMFSIPLMWKLSRAHFGSSCTRSSSGFI